MCRETPQHLLKLSVMVSIFVLSSSLLADVRNKGGLAIIAGSDTISSAISNLFYLLLTNPEKYKRLQAEIDELGHEVMDYGKQGQLGYLNGAM